MAMPTSGRDGRPSESDDVQRPAEPANDQPTGPRAEFPAGPPDPADPPDPAGPPDPADPPASGEPPAGTPSPEPGHQPQADWRARDEGGRTDWTSTNAPGVGWNPGPGGPAEPGDSTEAGVPTPQRPRPAWDSSSRMDLPGVSPITRAERRRAQQAAAAASAGWPEGDQYPGTVGHLVWALVRLALAFLFLWTFADNLVGLDRPTPPGSGWLDGVSPTADYLKNVHNSLAPAYHLIAGQAWVDWVFMISLAVVGLALLLGIAMTLTAALGAAMLVVVWLSALPLVGAPVIDDRLVYALILIGIASTGAGLHFSLAPWWRDTALVRRLPLLR
ncbi:hypothetical protein [Rhizomonospora bruguierae]|uniref:hypothetical protein n=1 Tax=Rhizomonospora bruguierae TaxID=1581705 RepID=UPI001BCAB799|nr:hypothetical protein [Micromonospora sp. NBRC 107566]